MLCAATGPGVDLHENDQISFIQTSECRLKHGASAGGNGAMNHVAEDTVEFTYFRGRVALRAILHALGVAAGDEIAIQAYTCVAVPEAILSLGARPVYVDITPEGYGIDAGDLESKITPRTRAIVAQHTFGIPASMNKICETARRWGIPVVEDCAHTLESSIDGRMVGSFGIASFYSFEWGKPIVAGIGGSATAAEANLRARLRAEYETYEDPGSWRSIRISLEYRAYSVLFRPSLYHALHQVKKLLDRNNLGESTYHTEYGIEANRDFGFRMASGCKKRLRMRLLKLSEITEHSQRVSAQYRTGITSSLVKHPHVDPGAIAVYARYPLASPEKSRICELARSRFLEVGTWYESPVHPLQGSELGLVGYRLGQCPNAEKRADEVFHLPTHRRANAAYVNRVLEFFAQLTI